MQDMYKYMRDSIPADHCRQSTAINIAIDKIKKFYPNMIVDLGCGTGSSYDVFQAHFKGIHWVGVDIEKSPEVLSRTRICQEFITYDGVNLPFENNSVDFIYSNQVLEHIQFPEKVLKDVHRVLREVLPKIWTVMIATQSFLSGSATRANRLVLYAF